MVKDIRYPIQKRGRVDTDEVTPILSPLLREPGQVLPVLDTQTQIDSTQVNDTSSRKRKPTDEVPAVKDVRYPVSKRGRLNADVDDPVDPPSPLDAPHQLSAVLSTQIQTNIIGRPSSIVAPAINSMYVDMIQTNAIRPAPSQTSTVNSTHLNTQTHTSASATRSTRSLTPTIDSVDVRSASPQSEAMIGLAQGVLPSDEVHEQVCMPKY